MPRRDEFRDRAADAAHATAVLGPLLGTAPMLTAWVWAILYSVWACGPCCTCSHTPPLVPSPHMCRVCGGAKDGSCQEEDQRCNSR